MKHFFLFSLVCLALVTGSSVAQSRSSVAALDRRNGLLDATFGMPARELEDLKLVSSVGPKQVYERSGKRVTFSGHPVQRVHYTFYNDQLCSIMINVAGQVNNEGVLRTLKQSYGPGAAEGNTHTWDGQVVSLVFGTMGQGNGVVSVSNKSLVTQMKKGVTSSRKTTGIL